MKAFLMHRDRDFDPSRIVSRRERELRPSNRDRSLDLDHVLPWNEAALTQDLGLNILLSAMADEDSFLFEVSKVALLSPVTEPEAILYRQEVLQDCLRNAAAVRAMYDLAFEAVEAERKNYFSLFSRYPGGILNRAIDVLQMFVSALRRLRKLADDCRPLFKSEGFSRLFLMLQTELSDDYFDEIERHLKLLKFRGGVLVAAQLGAGNKATDYMLCKPQPDTLWWLARLLPEKQRGYTFHLHPRDEPGARALSELRDQGVNLVANALAQSTDHILSFFQMLRTELAFYVGCLNVHQKITGLGGDLCFPKPSPARSRRLSFSGLYDICLTVSAKKSVVANDLNSDGKDLLIITGANTGGKSTFMRSIGLAQLMMQAGMFVGANAFTADIRDAVITHYRREEDTTMESGKFDEELKRMSDIVDHISPAALMLFNESFAATNEREGSEIAVQITNALVESGVKVIFVTHQFEFANAFYQRKLPGAKFLRAERRADGSRPFKLIEGGPKQTSYGQDLYQREFGTVRDEVDRKYIGGQRLVTQENS